MAWNHPHSARVKAGKGPKGKRQRRLQRERAEREKLGGQFKEEERRAPVDTFRPSWR